MDKYAWIYISIYYVSAPAHRAEELSDAFVYRLTSVWRLYICLSRTSGLIREQRGLGRLKLAQR